MGVKIWEEQVKTTTMALIRVKNLLLRTFIGFNPEELANQQDVIINLEIEADIPEEAWLADEPVGK